MDCEISENSFPSWIVTVFLVLMDLPSEIVFNRLTELLMVFYFLIVFAFFNDFLDKRGLTSCWGGRFFLSMASWCSWSNIYE